MAEVKLFPHTLHAGVHFGPDYEAEPVTEKVENPTTKEVTERTTYPTKRFDRGSTFYDKNDLVALEPARYGVPGAREGRKPVTVKVASAADVKSAPTGPDEGGKVRGGDGKLSAEDAKAKAAKDAAYREELEGMNVEDLREHAKEGNIQLHGARTKADIVDAILKGDKTDDGE